MSKIIELKDISKEEKIYFKKGFFGYKIVYPIKINGKINWKNLIAGGSWIKLILLIAVVLLILGCVWEYSNAVNIANECLSKNPMIILP